MVLEVVGFVPVDHGQHGERQDHRQDNEKDPKILQNGIAEG